MLKKMIVVLVVTLAGIANAQTQPTGPATAPLGGICFVTAQQVLQNHPQGTAVLEGQKKAQQELNTLAAQIQALQVKVANGSATAADRQQLETLIQTYQSRGEQLKRNIDKLLEPITEEVDEAIGQVAQTRGCALVLDRAIAGSSGLIVYANSTTVDITDDVIALLRKK
jgi:outer membrane protein